MKKYMEIFFLLGRRVSAAVTSLLFVHKLFMMLIDSLLDKDINVLFHL